MWTVVNGAKPLWNHWQKGNILYNSKKRKGRRSNNRAIPSKAGPSNLATEGSVLQAGNENRSASDPARLPVFSLNRLRGKPRGAKRCAGANGDLRHRLSRGRPKGDTRGSRRATKRDRGSPVGRGRCTGEGKKQGQGTCLRNPCFFADPVRPGRNKGKSQLAEGLAWQNKFHDSCRRQLRDSEATTDFSRSWFFSSWK